MSKFSESAGGEAGDSQENVQESESFQDLENVQDPDTFGLFSTLSELRVDPAGLKLSEFDTSEPLGILVELVKNEKIDPWDIDIVKLTDSFLGRIEELKQLDLRISSRTLLYSAILLRMKSNGILREEVEEEDDFDFFEDSELPEPDEFPVPKLPMRRKATRPVTLNELISELKKAEKALSRKREKKKNEDKVPDKKMVPFKGNVLGIAHEEAIVERVDLAWEKLAGLFRDEGTSYVTFSRFLEGSSDRVMDYISLLFLASNKKIWLCQQELFEELYIYPGKESGIASGKTAFPTGEQKLPKSESESETPAPETSVSENSGLDPGKSTLLPLPSEPVSFVGAGSE